MGGVWSLCNTTKKWPTVPYSVTGPIRTEAVAWGAMELWLRLTQYNKDGIIWGESHTLYGGSRWSGYRACQNRILYRCTCTKDSIQVCRR